MTPTNKPKASKKTQDKAQEQKVLDEIVEKKDKICKCEHSYKQHSRANSHTNKYECDECIKEWAGTMRLNRDICIIKADKQEAIRLGLEGNIPITKEEIYAVHLAFKAGRKAERQDVEQKIEDEKDWVNENLNKHYKYLDRYQTLKRLDKLKNHLRGDKP